MQKEYDLDTASATEEFQRLVESITFFAQRSNIPLKAHTKKPLQYFKALNEPAKERVLKGLRMFEEICMGAATEKISAFDTKRMTWYAFKKMGLVPTSDLLEKIGPNDFVEIYDTSFIQAFRDFNFFHVCSYSLEDLTCRSYDQLYRRDDKTQKAIEQLSIRFLSGELNTTVIPDIPEHVVTEIDSAFEYVCRLKYRCFSPVFSKNNKLAAIVVVGHAELLSKMAPFEEEHHLKQHLSRSL